VGVVAGRFVIDVEDLSGVGVIPKDFAGLGGKTIHDVVVAFPTHRIRPVSHDGNSGEADSDLGLPKAFETLFRPVGQPTGFERDPIPIDAPKLRPIQSLGASSTSWELA
jgi:hypothetical protein